MKKVLMLVLAVLGLAAMKPASVEALFGFGNSGCGGCCECGSVYVGPIVGANWLQTSKKKNHHHSDSDEEFFDRRDVEFDTGYNVGGFIGYHFCSGLDLEAEFIYRFNELKRKRECFEDSSFRTKGDFRSMSYMVNAIYEINLRNCGCSSVVPYIGVGIGYAQQELKIFSCKFKEDGFAWQVLAGLGYKINNCFDVALDYHFNQGRTHRIYNHSLSLAAAYHFSL